MIIDQYLITKTMLKKVIKITIITVLFLGIFTPATLADELLPIETGETPSEETRKEEVEIAQLIPVITSEDFIVLNKKALFDAVDSKLLPTDVAPTYRWDFSDVTMPQFGKEVVHEFNSTGIHRVTLTIQQGEFKASVDREVFVYDKKILMVTDKDIAEEFQLIANQAAHNGVLLKIVSAVEEETGFLTEEKLVPLIAEENEFIKEADGFIFYTNSSMGLQAFTRYWQNLEDNKKINLQKKLIVKITDQNIGMAAKLAQQSFQVIQPKFILLTRKE